MRLSFEPVVEEAKISGILITRLAVKYDCITKMRNESLYNMCHYNFVTPKLFINQKPKYKTINWSILWK